MSLAIIAITPGGAALARRLRQSLPEASVHLPAGLRAADGCRYFDEPLAGELPRLFAEGRDLLCIMATGIVVRLLAPHLRGKAVDPAVVVMDEGGRFAVSLLSGHLGGANALAQELAQLSGGTAVITTATDVHGLTAWDEAARREDLGIEPVAHIKVLNSLLLRGEKIALVDRQGRLAGYFEEVPGIIPCNHFAEALRAETAGGVFVTNRRIPGLEEQENLLLLRPRDLVVGIGCNRGTAGGGDRNGGEGDPAPGVSLPPEHRLPGDHRSQGGRGRAQRVRRPARLAYRAPQRRRPQPCRRSPLPPRRTPWPPSAPRGSASRPPCSPPIPGRCW